ncbi:MAG TPA: cupin domain-containing protein [Burkholderiaceae bacterium]|nr:cupin domain-containing protein [Burkholderiaceae bacterium]
MTLIRLGRLPVADFMRRYWQKKPVVLRAALPDFVPPIAPPRLFQLAARADVESRLVTSFDGWRLRHGPFARLPARTRARWTLLVQGVDAHDEGAAALLQGFRFVPDARLDDLMVSYASDGGGVGPHVDSYDVFLLQAQGRRRWRVSRQRDRALVPGLPLEILAGFKPTAEWVLEPGDVLYLPPGVAHEGVAAGGDCVTYSIGFRSPAWAELIDPLLDTLGERHRPPGRYRDPAQPATATPARLPPALVDAAGRHFARLLPTRADVVRTLLVSQSEPKPSIVFERPRRPLPAAQFETAARRRGVTLDRRTRLLYDTRAAAINGEVIDRAHTGGWALHTLADRRKLSAVSLARARVAWPALHAWYVAGWLHLGSEP